MGLLPRNDLVDRRSPEGLEIYQITTDPDVPACHISMEAQVFTPDSNHFLMHRGVGVQSFDHKTPGHEYLLCEVDSGDYFPVTDEVGAVAPSMAPDGSCFYYFVDETLPGKGRLILRRRNVDGTEPTTLAVLDGEIPGTRFRASRPNALSTISSDGSRLALACFLGDGIHSGGSFGLLIFQLDTGEVHLVLHGPTWRNIHAQYCRSLDEDHSHDILIQENHGGMILPDGRALRASGGRGADIHVIRDDGQHFRNLPWGRSELEMCSGHQCWRGRSHWAIGSLVTGGPEDLRAKCSQLHLVESEPGDYWDHHGTAAPDAIRNRLCAGFPKPHFNHFASDLSGRRLIADYRPCWDPAAHDQDALYFMELGAPGREPAHNIEYLFSPRSSWLESGHVHPFFSPDGQIALFNSDETGQTQAYLVRGLPGIS